LDIEVYNEAIANADLAFGNDKYESALKWFDKALEEAPEDEYALSKAGAVCVSMERYEEAFNYFQRALDANPENGDSMFNMASAYFFAGDIPKAMDCYSKAEMMECSEDVKARIYYQLAMICSLKEDYQAALINFQKYEDMDTTGTAALDTDLISEKLNIYLSLEDLDNAAKCAVQWLNLAPSDIRCYMVYFNVLMAKEDYARAITILDDALKYAVKGENEKFAVDVSRANYYITAAGSQADSGDFDEKGYELLNQLIVSPYGSAEEKNELVLALAELCIKLGKVEEAVDLLHMVTDGNTSEPEVPKTTNAVDSAEIAAMMDEDMERMDAMLSSGEVDENAGEYAAMNYDESGNPVREFPDDMFDVPREQVKLPELNEEAAEKAFAELGNEMAQTRAAEFRDKVNFLLLSCYAYQEDFEKALEYSHIVKHNPDNVHYAFFGRYSEAFCMMQLAKRNRGVTMEEAERKYQEEIAFFRNEMMKTNENAAYALIFRTRMYAELGKFTKAEELSDLMADSDKAAMTDYIAQCRQEMAQE